MSPAAWIAIASIVLNIGLMFLVIWLLDDRTKEEHRRENYQRHDRNRHYI